jgi:membrane protein required for colicin V production
VVLVGLVSLAPVQQDSWWQESSLLPHFLLVADWSKNLILSLSSQWLASGVSAPVELPFKEALQQPRLP